jgi:hypothetical protein
MVIGETNCDTVTGIFKHDAAAVQRCKKETFEEVFSSQSYSSICKYNH